ncbi:hypothetical protein GOODEAATRI_011620, partial [Goodea atripinnis]
LSFCKVTEDGCSSLRPALTSKNCSLRMLDLSFNHLTDKGIKMLKEKQMDSSCSLENLNVDHTEECWVNLKLLRNCKCVAINLLCNIQHNRLKIYRLQQLFLIVDFSPLYCC